MSQASGLIVFYFDDVRRSITIEEALILSDWLHKTRVLAACPLVERLDSEMQAQDLQGIELISDERIVLRELLTNADLGEYGGLKKLAQVLQAVTLTEPLEGEESAEDS
jgi:hypothetical protein